MQKELLQPELFSEEESNRLSEIFAKEQRENKKKLLNALRQKLELVYFTEPKTNNDIMLNLQYEYLRKGSESAKVKLWVMAYQMVGAIMGGELKRRKLHLSQDEKDDNISKAVIDVMKRYDKVYYRGTKAEREAKLFPYAYSVKNYVFQFQLAIKKTLGYKPHIEYSLEDIERIGTDERFYSDDIE